MNPDVDVHAWDSGRLLTREGCEQPNLSLIRLQKWNREAVFLAKVSLLTWPELSSLGLLVKCYNSQGSPLHD